MAEETFRTVVTVPEQRTKYDYSSGFMFIGSCFTEHISEKMRSLKFSCLSNPSGVVYNPFSISQYLERAVEKREYREDEVTSYKDTWLNLEHSTAFNSADKVATLSKINHSLKLAGEFLSKANMLVISFGTSWGYRYKVSGEIVANCHKIPGKEFEKVFISPEEATKGIFKALNIIRRHNPNIHLCFTVSPVRHIRDGFEENCRSKSSLVVAIHNVLATTENCSYFPAYEIMMDDLRDYRFYKSDMIHPSEVAVDYIWEKFKFGYISEAAYEAIEEIEQLQKALNHKIKEPGSSAGYNFVKQQLERINRLSEDYKIDLSEEAMHFERLLKSP